MNITVNTVPFQSTTTVSIVIANADAAIAFYDATDVYMDDAASDEVSNFKVYENKTQLGGITLLMQDAIKLKAVLEDHGVFRLGCLTPAALRSVG